jgi:hypothetical protein
MQNSSAWLLRVAMVALVYVFTTSSTANDSNDPPRGDKVRLNEVKARAARDFGVRYPQIGNERWYRYAEGFSAKFSQNQVLSNVYYDRMGYFVTTIRYYKEKNIPAKVKKEIQHAFEGYAIVSATEVITLKESSFHFNIKSKTRLKTVKLTDREMEVTADYRNGDQDL